MTSSTAHASLLGVHGGLLGLHDGFHGVHGGLLGLHGDLLGPLNDLHGGDRWPSRRAQGRHRRVQVGSTAVLFGLREKSDDRHATAWRTADEGHAERIACRKARVREARSRREHVQMSLEVKSLSVPQWKLRRIAGRVLRVLDDHGGSSPIISSYDASVRAAVAAFVQAHDALAVQVTGVHELAKRSHEASGALLKAVRGWLGLIARDLPGFDAQGLSEQPTPDDVLALTSQLLEVVKQAEAAVPWRDALVSDLEALLERSRQAWQDVRRGRASVQELQGRNREAAAALQAQLVPLRRSLRAVLGVSHLDYQSLRTGRVRDAEVEEDTSPAAQRADAPQSVASAQPTNGLHLSNGHS